MKRKIYFTALGLLVSTAFNVNGADWPNYGMSGYDDGMGEFNYGMNGYDYGMEEFREPLIKSIRIDDYAAHPYIAQYINGFTDGQTLQPINGNEFMPQQPGFPSANFSVPNTISPEALQNVQYIIDPANLAYSTQPAPCAVPVMEPQGAQYPAPPTNEGLYDNNFYAAAPAIEPQGIQYVDDAAANIHDHYAATATAPAMELQWTPIPEQFPAYLVEQLKSLNENNPVVIDGNTAYIYYYSNTSKVCLRSLYSINNTGVTEYRIVRKTNAGEILIRIPIRDADQKTQRSVIVFPGSDESYKMDTELNLGSILKQRFVHFQASTQNSISTVSKIISKRYHDPVPAEFANIDAPTVRGSRLYLPEWLEVQYIGELLECLRLKDSRNVYNIREVCIRTLLGNHFFVDEINTLNDKEYIYTSLHNGKIPTISILPPIARYLKILSDSELSKSQKTRKACIARLNLKRILVGHCAATASGATAPEER